MKQEDRERLHQLLDYAIDQDEEYVIMQYATMDLEWQLRVRRYRLHIKIEEETKYNTPNNTSQ